MTRYPFPKIDLHLHLDGSLLPATMVELAAAQGVPLPADTPEGYLEYVREATGCGSVNRYLEVFEHPVAVMQDAGSITRITKELIELLASQGVAAAEIRMAPQLHTRRGLTQAEVTQAVLEGRRQGLAACPDIKIGILLCMMCIGPEAVSRAGGGRPGPGRRRGLRPAFRLCAAVLPGCGAGHPLYLPRRGQPGPRNGAGRHGFRRTSHWARPPHIR